MEINKKASHRLYARYEYLAKVYANKLFDFDVISFEKEDVVQELKLKIFTSIIAYGKRYKTYLDTKRYKPVPLLFYIKAVLNNKIKDYMKQITREKKTMVSLDTIEFDIGRRQSQNIIDFESRQVIVNGVDLMEGLTPHEKTCFGMFLRGWDRRHLNHLFRLRFDASLFINNQLAKMQELKEVLSDSDTNEIFYSAVDQEETH